MTTSAFTYSQPLAPRRQGVSVHFVVGTLWLWYWLSNSYVWIGDTIPFFDYYVVVALFLIYISLARPVQVIQFMTRPGIWLWVITVIVPAIMYFSLDRPSSFNYVELRTRITFLSIVGGTALVLNDPDGGRILRRAAGLALLMAILVNFSEIFVTNPYNRVTTGGRSAGFYGDANISAHAIGAILLLSVDITKQSRRGLVIVGFALLGILITLSRSGIAWGAVLGFGYLFFPRGRDTLPFGSRLAVAWAGLFAAVLIVSFAVIVLDFDTRESWRLRSMLTLDIRDDSSQGRIDRLLHGIEQMQRDLWTGRGPGESRSHDLVAHNTYVTVGYEYGLIGAAIFGGLIGWGWIKLLAHSWRRAATYGMLSTQLAFFSMFDHTMFSHPVIATILGIFLSNAALSDPEEEHDPGASERPPMPPHFEALLDPSGVQQANGPRPALQISGSKPAII